VENTTNTTRTLCPLAAELGGNRNSAKAATSTKRVLTRKQPPVQSKQASLLKAAYVTTKHRLVGFSKLVTKDGAAPPYMWRQLPALRPRGDAWMAWAGGLGVAGRGVRLSTVTPRAASARPRRSPPCLDATREEDARP
jgi:hypothetical protein